MSETPTVEVVQFNPTVAELNKIVESAKSLVITDHKDKAQLEVVRAKRIELKKVRVQITNRGKELREDAIKMQKFVIEKEKELVAIISPEEDRLQALEDEVAITLEKERRLALLDDKVTQLTALYPNLESAPELPTPEFLLTLSDEAWSVFYNDAVTQRNETQRLANEEAMRLIEEEKKKLEDERLERERKEKAEAERLEREETERIAREKKAEQDRLDKIELDRIKAEDEKRVKEQNEKLQAEKIERAKVEERERIEREAKEQADREEAERVALEKKKIYQKFLADGGYTEETKTQFTVINKEGVIHLYKLVNTLDLS